MNRLLKVVVPLVPGALLAMVTAAFAATDGPTTPSELNAAPIVVRDDAGRSSLAIQLERSRADTGSFAFDVAGLGTYEGTIVFHDCNGISTSIASRQCQSDQVTFNDQSSSTLFFAQDGGTGVPVAANMRGAIDTSDLSAETTFATATTSYKLQARPARSGEAQVVAQQALSAMSAGDWNTVYGMLAVEVKTSYTQDQFVARLTGTNLPSIRSAQLVGGGQIIHDAGFTYYVQSVVLVAQPTGGGGETQYQSKILLVFEQGSWRLMGTQAPASA